MKRERLSILLDGCRQGEVEPHALARADAKRRKEAPVKSDAVRPIRIVDDAIVFLTGRKEPQRPATERALREAGFGEWTELILRGPDESELEAGEFKSGRRAKLEAAGYVIALTVGDQASDLSGGHSEATLLMPNPFYMVK